MPVCCAAHAESSPGRGLSCLERAAARAEHQEAGGGGLSKGAGRRSQVVAGGQRQQRAEAQQHHDSEAVPPNRPVDRRKLRVRGRVLQRQGRAAVGTGQGKGASLNCRVEANSAREWSPLGSASAGAGSEERGRAPHLGNPVACDVARDQEGGGACGGGGDRHNHSARHHAEDGAGGHRQRDGGHCREEGARSG